MRSSVITTFPSLTKPSPASANATAVTPVASSSVTSAIAAVAAARAAQAQAQAAQAATIAATVTQPPITTSVSPAASIVTTVNGRKRRNSNSSSNGLSPTYPRMENSSNLSQSMDSVNTASGEEEVSTLTYYNRLPVNEAASLSLSSQNKSLMRLFLAQKTLLLSIPHCCHCV